jgi:hypothetical protein
MDATTAEATTAARRTDLFMVSLLLVYAAGARMPTLALW